MDLSCRVQKKKRKKIESSFTKLSDAIHLQIKNLPDWGGARTMASAENGPLDGDDGSGKNKQGTR